MYYIQHNHNINIFMYDRDINMRLKCVWSLVNGRSINIDKLTECVPKLIIEIMNEYSSDRMSNPSIVH